MFDVLIERNMIENVVDAWQGRRTGVAVDAWQRSIVLVVGSWQRRRTDVGGSMRRRLASGWGPKDVALSGLCHSDGGRWAVDGDMRCGGVGAGTGGEAMASDGNGWLTGGLG